MKQLDDSLTVRRLQGCGAHKGLNFEVRERCRKVETVPVVFRSGLCTGFLVVSMEFHLSDKTAQGQETEHVAGGLSVLR